MIQTYSLFRREFMAFFISPVAYAVLAFFLGVNGYLFALVQDQLTAQGPRGTEFPMQMMLSHPLFWIAFLFIPPLLTMRLFAEERSTGTLEMLMTAPLADWQIVLSKYLAVFAFYAILWLPTLLYLPYYLQAKVNDQPIDPMPFVSSYLGLILVGAMFLAIGLFVSSLVRSQVVAALISLFACLIFVVAGFWQSDTEATNWYRTIYFFSVPLHFQRDFGRGIIDSRHLVLYSSVALLCLFLTVRSLETRRWR
jgi:ABC-2 type transport system permease protein